MNLPASFFDIKLYVGYATLAKLNRIRAVARKNRATVHVTRYAHNAYEGHVTVPTRWDEGKDKHDARIVAVRQAIQE